MTKRGIFLAYCAYAPFIQVLAMVFMWTLSGMKGDPNNLVWYGLLPIIPLSAWLLVETTIFFPSAMASNFAFVSHTFVYSYFYAAHVLAEYQTVPLPSDSMAVPVVMTTLTLASISLLMTWDNMRSKQGSTQAASESIN